MTAEELRFWDKVRIGDGCWEWTGSIASGYGRFGVRGPRPNIWLSERAHRVSWQFEHGGVPEDKCVLHRCDNRRCVRPSHLFLGTRTDNSADKVAKGRQARGSRNAFAVLDEAAVLDIRRRHAAGEAPQAIAESRGVHVESVRRIVRGKTWRHVA